MPAADACRSRRGQSMVGRTASDIAQRIDRLFRGEFGGQKSGNFRLLADDFRALAKRSRIEDSVFKDIAAALFKNHRRVLARSGTYYVVAAENTVLRWREAPVAIVRKEAARKLMTAATKTVKAATGLSPQAAWPFPASQKP